MKKVKHILIIFLAFVSLCATWYYRESSHSEDQYFNEGVDAFTKGLGEVKRSLNQEITTFSKKIANDTIDQSRIWSLSSESQDIAICMLKGKEVVYWTNSKFPVEETTQLQDGIHQLSNGWYYLQRLKLNHIHDLVALYQIKKEFKQENQYLQNHFNNKISLDDDWDLSPSGEGAAKAFLVDQHGNEEVYLKLKESLSYGSHYSLSFIEILLIMLVLYASFGFNQNKSNLKAYGTVIMLIGFRLLLLYSSLGIHYKELELFQPELYAASDFSPSFGDLVLHLIFLSLIGYLLFGKKDKIAQSKFSKLYVMAGTALIFAAGVLLSSTLESLVNNSIVPLDLSDVSKLNYYSAISLLFICAAYFTYYLFSKSIIARFSGSFTTSLIALSAAVFVCILMTWFSFPIELSFTSWLWVVPLYFLIIFKLNKSLSSGFSLLHYFPEILLFSVLFTVQMESIKTTKESSRIEQILEREAQERDPIAEFLIYKSSTKIIKNLKVAKLDSSAINEIIAHDYLSKYLNKFDISWSLDELPDNKDNENIKKGAHSSYTKINELLFRKMAHGSVSYLTKILLDTGELSILFTAKEIPVNQGFPMLLASKSIEKMALGQGYSFAKYKDGRLVNSKGKYPFETVSKYYAKITESNLVGLSTRWVGGFKHTLLSKNGNAYVLSSNDNSYLSLVANLSYMLFFLGIVLFLGGVVYRLYSEKVLFPKDFKRRLQYAILFMLFFSTLVIGLGSVYFLREQYNKENFEAISEKINSVTFALSRRLDDGRNLQMSQADLNELASTFFTDINLYDSKGVLVQTSQANIFEAGVLTKLLNPKAFQKIFNENKAICVQIEHIEEMNYLSAYVPLYDDQEHLLGCLNLPYFAKTNELQSEINGFMVALINMYLLLTVLSIAVALLISDRIIKPLQIIKTKIANFNLKDKPEQIVWETNDEIGALVKEYNRMVNELSESALRLAQAEREGAWKEMAQQVAHEIKNPLTPMKLNIQHFNMKWNALREDERKAGFSELTNNLVEQIDTLSAIAEQFSNFARIPEPKRSVIDLVAVLKNSTGIYNGSNEVPVECDIQTDSTMVVADKDQLLRIFNNVIKNAIQSIPADKKGLVTVKVKNEKGMVLVKISDNGSGISQEQKALIFQPNFTTKSSGMGLGLAMVKKMLESIDASISFESKEGLGTSFYLGFKQFRKEV